MQAPIIWAQKKDVVMVTVQVPDAINPTVEITANSIRWAGKGAKSQNEDWKIELCNEIDPEKSKFVVKPRATEILLQKKDDTIWWPRLAKQTKRLPYVGVDWARWVDSSDSEDEKAGFDWDPSAFGDMDFGEEGEEEDDGEGEEIKPETEA